MSKYYTNVAVQGNNILFRGIKNGRRVKMKIQYSPTLFLPSKKTSEWKTLFNENLEPMKFGDIRDARDFVRKYDGVELVQRMVFQTHTKPQNLLLLSPSKN